MCFSVDEAVFLAEHGFDDLLVAYPSLQAGSLGRLAAPLLGRVFDWWQACG